MCVRVMGPRACCRWKYENDVDRLEALMKMMVENKNAGEDPEMKQLNAMMENIIDIQHPERVKTRLVADKK